MAALQRDDPVGPAATDDFALGLHRASLLARRLADLDPLRVDAGHILELDRVRDVLDGVAVLIDADVIGADLLRGERRVPRRCGVDGQGEDGVVGIRTLEYVQVVDVQARLTCRRGQPGSIEMVCSAGPERDHAERGDHGEYRHHGQRLPCDSHRFLHFVE